MPTTGLPLMQRSRPYPSLVVHRGGSGHAHNECMDGCMHGCVHRWTNQLIDKWVVGGWIDKWIRRNNWLRTLELDGEVLPESSWRVEVSVDHP